MAQRKKSKRRNWSQAELKTLKALAGKKTATAIGKVLKRTVAALRFKAHQKRISLALK